MSIRYCCAALAIVAVARLPTWSQDEGAALPVVAPVKALSSGNASPETRAMDAMMAMAAPDGPQPTLPGGKLPQYQVGRASRETLNADDLNNARLRFILALPARPVLVEAEITIDGRPFRMAREERIAEILEALRIPPPEPTPEAASNSASDEADATVEIPAEDTEDEPTEPAEQEAGSEDEAESQEEDAEPEPEPVTPPTVAAYSLANSATEYIRRYAAATRTEPSADEIRWLLANWSEGPVLLMLQENFQRFRARERPVFDVLDRDRDGTVSSGELEQAVDSFNECDLDRDQVVSAIEISESADDPRRRAAATDEGGPLVFAVSDTTAAESVYQRLAARYVDGQLDRDGLQSLLEGTPDVNLTVAFNTDDRTESAIAVTAVSDDAAIPTAVDSSIVLPLAGATVVFSAVQGRGDQVSLGAVADGYPLLPEIDPNDDGRFTIREMRGLVDDLKRLDTNGDGSLTADEAQAPVRVCFGLGPVVHRELAGIRSVSREQSEPTVEGPDWFVRMDRNKDRDLTRGEFPGTDEQFTALDADGDELVSAAEALEFDQVSRNTDSDSDAADPDPETPADSESETE